MAAGPSSSGGGGVPPGFRFHPTDEELLHFYLKKKVSFQKFEMDVIREVDLNKIEPWDLQEKCKIGSTPQNEWYFFSHKDRKYPTGSRTNRATSAGFWKATGRDKCIRNSFKKIGMRKTLVFYRGRAPHGQKTDWIMHEYRLHDSDDHHHDPPPNEDGWVVCRVFKKKNLFKINGSNAAQVGLILPNTNTCDSAPSTIFTHQSQLRDHNNNIINNNNNHHQYLPDHHPAHAAAAAADLNYSHIPLHYPQLEPHTFKPPPNSSIYDHPLPKQFMSTTRSDDHSCDSQPLPTTLHLREWDPHPLVVNAQDSDPTSINHLSLRSEMDFWAYGK